MIFNFFLVISIPNLFEFAKGINETINEGASTSGLQQLLSRDEQCEINSYVDNLLNLLADIRIEESLSPNELNSYLLATQNVYAADIEDYLKYGSDNEQIGDNRTFLPNHEERIRYYGLSIRREALETLIDSCSRHFHKLSQNIINQFLKNISSVSLNHIIRKRDSTSTLHINGSNRHGHSRKPNKSQENHGLPVSIQDVIPLSVIFRFFEEWFNRFTELLNAHDCPNLVQNHNSIGSKLIIPPRFDQVSVEAMSSFFFNSAAVIRQDQYEKLLSLVKSLIEYVETDSKQTTSFEKYMSGVELYISMVTVLARYKTLPPNVINQWEPDKMTKDDLSRFQKRKKLWTTKENFKRSRRYPVQKEVKCFTVDVLSQQRWSEFVVYLMSTFLQTDSNDKSVPWSKNFTRLYLEYRSNSLMFSNKNCLKFDTYLYSKISQSQDWFDCLNFKEAKKLGKWCQAWKRIMLNLNVGRSDIRKSVTSKLFHQDLKTLVNFLYKKIVIANQKIYTPKRLSSALKNLKYESKVCFRDLSSLECPNNCKSNNKTLSLDTDDFYGRKWILENDHTLKCECPENFYDNSVETLKNWLKNLWKAGINSRCSSDYDSLRCIDSSLIGIRAFGYTVTKNNLITNF